MMSLPAGLIVVIPLFPNAIEDLKAETYLVAIDEYIKMPSMVTT